MCFFALLWFAQKFVDIDFKARTAAIICSILVLYNFLFLLLPRLLRRWKGQYGWALLSILVCVELVVCNYDTVNLRDRIPLQQWYLGLYNDGTEDALDAIPAQDALYRINKTYDSVLENDSLVQNYNGLAVYSSTNSANLVNLFVTRGNNLRYNAGTNKTNWIRFPGNDVIFNSLLGVKYVLSSPTSSLPSANYYTEIYTTEENYSVYENNFWLGFGYLYTHQIDEQTFPNQRASTRELLLTHAYYEMGSSETENDTINSTAITDWSNYVQEIDLSTCVASTVNCSAELLSDDLVINATSNDLQLYFNLPEIPKG